MIVNFNKEIEKLQQIRSGKLKEGLRLGIPELDEHFRFKYTNFNVILGHANVGKTTTILYMMLLYSLKHNVKWLVYSSENEPYTINEGDRLFQICTADLLSFNFKVVNELSNTNRGNNGFGSSGR